MIAVLTDSTCDLPTEHVRQLGLHLAPLTVNLAGRTLLDWQEVDPDAVYDHMRAGGRATTAPVPAASFVLRYRELLRTHDQILSIHLSGKLSETVRHARQAVEELRAADRITVLDSELASAPLAEAVLAALATVQAGGTVVAAANAAAQVRREMHTEFSVASLEYLRRGGRIGRAQEFLGNMLGLRPVLHFEHGELKAVRRVKADQAAADMLARARDRFGTQPLSVALVHAGRDQARIGGLKAAMTSSGLNIKQGRVQLIGPVIGAHVGPGTYGFMARPVTPG